MYRSRRGWPFAVGEMQKDMDRWLEQLKGSAPVQPMVSSCAWEPLADVFETDDEVVVTVEAAGADRDSFQVVLEGDTLFVSGLRRERGAHQRPERPRYQQMEICCGSFGRAIPLPAKVSAEQASAFFEDGLLEIRLPRAAKPSPVRVTIKTSRAERTK